MQAAKPVAVTILRSRTVWAFTLIELLAVIVLIALLAGFNSLYLQ